jgi:hypothetical protein
MLESTSAPIPYPVISRPVEAVSRHVPEYHVCTNGLNNSGRLVNDRESTHTIPRSSEVFETPQDFHVDFIVGFPLPPCTRC